MATSKMAKYERQLMGSFAVPGADDQHVIDGRFLVKNGTHDCTIIDLFHSKSHTFCFEFPSSNIGESQQKTKAHCIHSVFPLDMHTAFLLFGSNDSNNLHVGMGYFDYGRSMFVVEQTTFVAVYTKAPFCTWFVQSQPSLGTVFKIAHNQPSRVDFYVVRLNVGNPLTVSRLEVPREMSDFECLDGRLYGLARGETSNDDANQPIDLIEFDFAERDQSRKRTINWDLAEGVNLESSTILSRSMCCIGRTLFVQNYREDEESEILSLHLDTLTWNSTGIILKNVWSIQSDGAQALIVQTPTDVVEVDNIYRFAVNKPDKLSNLIWLRLKPIFDARPDAYNSILSRLPKNLKQKCPFNFN